MSDEIISQNVWYHQRLQYKVTFQIIIIVYSGDYQSKLNNTTLQERECLVLLLPVLELSVALFVISITIVLIPL